MKEIKSKKTGRIEQLSDEAYNKMVKEAPPRFMERFTVTDLRSKPIIPSLKPTIIKNK